MRSLDRRVDDRDHHAVAARQAMRRVEPDRLAGILRRGLGRRFVFADAIVVIGLRQLDIGIGAERREQRLKRAAGRKPQAHQRAVEQRDRHPGIGGDIVLAGQPRGDLACPRRIDQDENLPGAVRAVGHQRGDGRRNILVLGLGHARLLLAAVVLGQLHAVFALADMTVGAWLGGNVRLVRRAAVRPFADQALLRAARGRLCFAFRPFAGRALRAVAHDLLAVGPFALGVLGAFRRLDAHAERPFADRAFGTAWVDLRAGPA